MVKESRIMREVHKVREEFYRETRRKNREYILKLIREESKEVIKELETIKPDTNLVVKEKYLVPQSDSIKEIHLVRERGSKYGK